MDVTHDTTDGALLEWKRVGDITGSFRVARYQRGYRWGQDEVTRLLDDVWENGDRDYSLQPVVVKREGELAWELIDGQQRLTTLYLVFLYMHRAGWKNVEPPFSLTYDTRPRSKDYLRTLDPAQANDNIDFFHMHAASVCIQKWFETKGPTPIKRQEVADEVFRFLCRRVRVIWYEAPKHLDATTLFTRLNVGRIPLTDAELFKALLLTRAHGNFGETNRTHELAAQWDNIERDLQRPELWAFIAEVSKPDPPTRITLLLDALAGGPKGRERLPFHTFHTLRARVERDGALTTWDQVVQLHGLVVGWYEHRDHYHKIGYLVAQGERFEALVELAKDKTRRALDAALDARIRDTLRLSPSEVSALRYDTERDRKRCGRILLLMNIETTRRAADPSARYSFHAHRRATWSIEHIHAQHAEALTRAEQWREWLRVHREALSELPSLDDAQRSELLHRIDTVSLKPEREDFERLARDITAVFTKTDTTSAAASHTVHSISNLALLASGHNSALSNAVFEVKRRRIIDLDRHGAYIPICTRQVFLKYYTTTGTLQPHFWSTHDREDYLRAILSRDGGVGAYLEPEASTP